MRKPGEPKAAKKTPQDRLIPSAPAPHMRGRRHRPSDAMQTYPGLLHLNGNLLVSVDLETTGRRPGYHEIIQIACVPLGPELKPAPGLLPFYTEIKPNFPERAEQQAKFKHNIPMEQLLLHAPDQDKVQRPVRRMVRAAGPALQEEPGADGAQLGL